ncbi:MAG TPA: hypothetical protein VKA03_06150 [Methylovirgula sp.]|nr:hypothetical protein [Methylovirgula sp.]
MVFAAAPLPPERSGLRAAQVSEENGLTVVPLPPERPMSLSLAYARERAPSLPKVIAGAQPILPASFLAYAQIAPLTQ